MAVQHGYDNLFEQALNTVNNRFLLSVLLAKRVAQLRKGAEPLVDSQGRLSHEEIVYREIVEGKLEWRNTAA
ncbi:MAG: DNA-directed RNA polymerase subunit omega, partial [Candidatus Tectomicrobia bacterium]|nr:DNA-directed RNA polymerase subunit omega [Candidatus Tectomicrobia bacterium]